MAEIVTDSTACCSNLSDVVSSSKGTRKKNESCAIDLPKTLSGPDSQHLRSEVSSNIATG